MLWELLNFDISGLNILIFQGRLSRGITNSSNCNVEAVKIKICLHLFVLKCTAACMEVYSVAEWSNMIVLIHLHPFALSLLFSLTHTHGCSSRKSYFIYEMYSSECHRLLLRIQGCTHTQSRTCRVSLFFALTRTQ